MPAVKLGTLIILVAGCLLVVGIVLLVVVEPRPPVRHFEVQVPSDRLGH